MVELQEELCLQFSTSLNVRIESEINISLEIMLKVFPIDMATFSPT